MNIFQTSGISLLVLLTACQAQTQSVESGQATTDAKIQALAKKYGVTWTPDPKLTTANTSTGNKVSLEELEKQFQAAAALRDQVTEESKQTALMQKELEQRRPDTAKDFFAIVDKYPLVKNQYVSQYGGVEGFEKFKETIYKRERHLIDTRQKEMKVKE